MSLEWNYKDEGLNKQRRRQQETTTSRSLMGIAWYRKDQWERFRAAAADRDAIDEDYEVWRSKAQDSFNYFMKVGTPATRIEIDLDELLQWCVAHNRVLDANARAEFTSEKLYQWYTSQRQDDVTR